MEIHAGDENDPEKPSKTEILFVSAPLKSYDNPGTFDDTDLSDIKIGNEKFFPIVDKFCYLGTMLTRDCRDDEDVCCRIKKAGNAFGSLRRSLFANPYIDYDAKGAVYRTLILSILLYGAETWCLTEKLYNQLRLFHHTCVRAMHRVNRRHVFLHHISNMELLDNVNVKSIEFYVTKCQLSWLGHVA